MKSERKQNVKAILTVGKIKFPLTESPNGKKHLEPILGKSKIGSSVNPLPNDVYDQFDADHFEISDIPKKKKLVDPHQARQACQKMTELPHVFQNSMAAWYLFLLCLLAPVIEIVLSLLQRAPIAVLNGVKNLPYCLSTVLNIMNGNEHLKNKHISIKRPNVVEPIIPVGSWAPSGNPEDYLGGWVKLGYAGKKRHLWIPSCHRVIAIAPGTPEMIARLVISSSPLVIPILCPSMAKLSDRPTIYIDGTAFFTADMDQLAVIEGFHPVIHLEIIAFIEWLTEKKRRIKKWMDSISKYYPSARNGRFTTIADADVQTVVAAVGLALLERFLYFASEKQEWLTSEEANQALMEAWRAVLPETAPSTISDDGSIEGALRWNDPRSFWIFLSHYIQENATHISASGAPVTREITGILHKLPNGIPYLIFPREPLLVAYMSWLRHRNGSVLEQTGHWMTDIQNMISNWGILIKKENGNSSWRFSFYQKGQAPANLTEKLACLAFPLDQLPPEIFESLKSALGPSFVSWNPNRELESEVTADA